MRCLEPFFTTKGERGTGLGLAMVYGAAKRHEAEVEIESVLGHGTAVRLLFPAATAGISSPFESSSAPSPASSLRILLVDDDLLLTRSLAEALELEGHRITCADGGQAGIDAFLSSVECDEPFDAVITDLGMPLIDGAKVAAKIKAASPSTPVILLTGWGSKLAADATFPPNVDCVLAKPPRLRELREALINYCFTPK
jgi:CheY-like chemotaxis protein